MTATITCRRCGRTAVYRKDRTASGKWLCGECRGIPHGTINGYTNHGCRCESCRDARREVARDNAPQPHNSMSVMHQAAAMVDGDAVSDLSWRFSAACATAETHLFYSDDKAHQAEAKRVCAGCPVRNACLTYAISRSEAYGIWGGMTAGERLQLAKGMARNGGRR